MKKNVLVFGLISGFIVSALMNYFMLRSYKVEDFESSMWFGYTIMLVAFSLIFVGVKNVRDKYDGGIISFGKAFRIGLYITLIASTMYVIVWLIDYYMFIPDFMDKYVAHTLNAARENGATETELTAQAAEMEKYKEMYKNPLMVILFTYMEILPVGLIISLISALILKRKPSGLDTLSALGQP